MPKRKPLKPSSSPRRHLGKPILKRPVVERYADYRAFLRDLFAHLKSKNSEFGYRTLAEACRLRSPSFFHLVINGKRNLGKDPGKLASITQGLGLSEREGKAFCDLVALNQANDGKQRETQLKKLVRRRPFRESQRIDGDSLAFLQSWQAVGIHALSDAPAFVSDPDWVAKQFSGMTKQQARKAIELLARIGFIRLLDGGKVESLQPHVTTSHEITGEIVRQYHLQVLDLAANAVNTQPAHRRNFGTVTARIPSERLPEMIAHLHQVINDFHAYAASLDSPEGMMVVQTNFQLFPLTTDEE